MQIGFGCPGQPKKTFLASIVVFIFASASLVVGCKLVPNDVIPGPSIQLASGIFKNLLVAGSEADGAFVLALYEGTGGEALEVIPLTSIGDTCNLGYAEYYHSASPTLGPGLRIPSRSSRIIYFEELNDAGRSPVHFSTVNCAVVSPEIADAELGFRMVYLPGSSDPEAYLVKTGSKELLKADPWSGVATPIASDVQWWDGNADRIWF